MNANTKVELRAEGFNSLQVIWAEESHRLMLPTQGKVRAVLDRVVALDEMLGVGAQLITTREGDQYRVLTGVVSEARLVASPVRDAQSRIAPTYELTIQGTLALFSQIFDCRIFQPTDESKNTTQDIVSGLLTELGILSDQQDWQLSQTYSPREYCVQYRESTLQFITRLLEDEGIFVSLHWDDKAREIYRFCDASSSVPRQPDRALPLRMASQQNQETDAVYQLDTQRHVHTGLFTTRSFDFVRPHLKLEGSSKASGFSQLERYVYNEPFTDPGRASAVAIARQQQLESDSHTLQITTDCLAIAVGARFDVLSAGEELPFFVKELTTHYRYSEQDTAESATNQYFIEAQVIPLTVPYRPPLLQPRPKIYGPETATVVAKPGTEPEGVETDKYGRVKVQFHWDRYGKLDDKSSCWIRVAQLQTSGSMVLPRVDWEVVVEFLDGDPDRPLVTGRLFNGRFMPPYKLPEGKTRTSLQTASSPAGGGKNEIRFEDAAGAEEVMIHSQYNTAIAAANNRKKNVTKDETLVIGNNAQIEVGGNQCTKISKGCEQAIGGDQSVTVSGNDTRQINAVMGVTVGGTATTSVAGNWMAMIGSPLDALIALGTAKAAAIASAQAEKVFNQVSGAAESAIGQLAAPIQDLIDKSQGINESMAQVADGKLAAASGVIGGAVALPTASDLFRNLASTPAFSRTADGADASAGGIALGGAVQAAVSGTLIQAARDAKKAALGSGESTSGGSGGGASEANLSGPAGDLAGFTQEDTAKGSGFLQYTVKSTHKETIKGNKLALVVEPINYNIATAMTDQIGAAKVEIVNGDRAESTEAAASETQPALVVVAKGGESETINGARQLNIGAALMETVKGDYSIEAGAMVGITGAAFDVKAKQKITIKCGASSIVIDGSGITFQTPAFTLTGSQVTAKKSVSDG